MSICLFSAAMAATASRDVRKQLSELECPICYEAYSDLRTLPCIHSYCLKCITEYCRDKLLGDAVAWPLCKKEFDIPQNGIAELPYKNFFMEQLKELVSPLTTHDKVCSTSEAEAAMRKSVAMSCMDCNQGRTQDEKFSEAKISLPGVGLQAPKRDTKCRGGWSLGRELAPSPVGPGGFDPGIFLKTTLSKH